MRGNTYEGLDEARMMVVREHITTDSDDGNKAHINLFGEFITLLDSMPESFLLRTTHYRCCTESQCPYGRQGVQVPAFHSFVPIDGREWIDSNGTWNDVLVVSLQNILEDPHAYQHCCEPELEACHGPSFDGPREVVAWPHLLVFQGPHIPSISRRKISQCPLTLKYKGRNLKLVACILNNRAHFTSVIPVKKGKKRMWCYYDGMRNEDRDGNPCFLWYAQKDADNIVPEGYQITGLIYETQVSTDTAVAVDQTTLDASSAEESKVASDNPRRPPKAEKDIDSHDLTTSDDSSLEESRQVNDESLRKLKRDLKQVGRRVPPIKRRRDSSLPYVHPKKKSKTDSTDSDSDSPKVTVFAFTESSGSEFTSSHYDGMMMAKGKNYKHGSSKCLACNKAIQQQWFRIVTKYHNPQQENENEQRGFRHYHRRASCLSQMYEHEIRQFMLPPPKNWPHTAKKELAGLQEDLKHIRKGEGKRRQRK